MSTTAICPRTGRTAPGGSPCPSTCRLQLPAASTTASASIRPLAWSTPTARPPSCAMRRTSPVTNRAPARAAATYTARAEQARIERRLVGEEERAARLGGEARLEPRGRRPRRAPPPAGRCARSFSARPARRRAWSSSSATSSVPSRRGSRRHPGAVPRPRARTPDSARARRGRARRTGRARAPPRPARGSRPPRSRPRRRGSRARAPPLRGPPARAGAPPRRPGCRRPPPRRPSAWRGRLRPTRRSTGSAVATAAPALGAPPGSARDRVAGRPRRRGRGRSRGARRRAGATPPAAAARRTNGRAASLRRGDERGEPAHRHHREDRVERRRRPPAVDAPRGRARAPARAAPARRR